MRIHPYAYAALERFLLASTLAIVLLLAVLTASAGARTSGYPVTIDMRETTRGDQAMPFNLAVQSQREVVLVIRNYTRELHTFAIPAIHLNVAVLPGSPQAPRTTRVRFVLPRYGVYAWFCWTCRLGFHERHQMGGKLYAWISPDLAIG